MTNLAVKIVDQHRIMNIYQLKLGHEACPLRSADYGKNGKPLNFPGEEDG